MQCINALCVVATVTTLVACKAEEVDMTFAPEGDRLVLEGIIDSDTQDALETVLEENPGIRTLVLLNIGGSADDEANLELGLFIRNAGLTTRVPGHGMVASGGTDLFLAGATRFLEPGACLGVHSWATDDYTARDIPKTSSEHTLYLDHYAEIGIDPDFYWFTLKAATAEDMHWMSASEAANYGFTQTAPPKLGDAATCDQR